MKLVLPASMLPDGSKVTKVSGEKRYTIRRSIQVYVKAGVTLQPQLLPAGDGVVFLVSAEGDATAYPATVEVAVHDEPHGLLRLLQQLAGWPRS